MGIKVFYKVIVSLLMGMNKHSQSNKLKIALQYAIEEVSCRGFQYKFDEESLTHVIKYFSAATAFVLKKHSKYFNEKL